MSAVIIIAGVASVPTSVRLTATTITDIYTAIDNNDLIDTIVLANETAGAVLITIDRFDGTTNWHTFIKSMPANDCVILPFHMRLLTGHKIKATAGTANAITVTVVRTSIPGRNIAGGQ